MGTSTELRELALRYRVLATSGSEMDLRAAMRRISTEFAARAVAEEIEEISAPPDPVIVEICQPPSWWGLILAGLHELFAPLLADLRLRHAPTDANVPAG